MKYFLLILSIILPSVTMLAQPILQASDMNIQEGDQFAYKYDTNLVANAAGANQSWDFTSIKPNFSAIFIASAPNSSTFGTATVELTSNGLGTSNFYDPTSSAISITGKIDGGKSFIFDNPQIVLQYPFQFGNSFSDAWSSSFISGGNNFYRHGNDTVMANGFGSLKTFITVHNSVLRVTTKSTYWDSLMNVANFIGYNSIENNFYKVGVHQPIVIIREIFTNGVLSTKQSLYLDYVVQHVRDIHENIFATLTIAPNPAKDFIQVAFNEEIPNDIEIRFSDAMGKLVSFEQTTVDGRTLQLHPKQIVPGNYYISFFANGNKIGGRAVQFL